MTATYTDITGGEFSPEEVTDLRARHAALAELPFDAVIAASPANVRYLSGTSFLTMRTIPERIGALVIAPQREAVFVYCSVEVEHATQESFLDRGLAYTEFVDHPVDVIAAHIRREGLASSRLGVEGRFLSGQDLDRLRAALPSASFGFVDRALDSMRAVKSAAERAALVSAATRTDEAIVAAFRRAVPGMTERELGRIMVDEALARGADEKLFQTMVSGANGFKAHAGGSDRTLRAGDVVRTDFGMIWPGGYLSDIAHVAFVGAPSRAQRDVYLRLEGVHQALAGRMSAGTPAGEVYRHALRLMQDAGLDFICPHAGHNIGLVLHENPMMQPFEREELREGMVLMLEPIVRAADGLYHVEDLVVVGPDGGTIASRSRDWSEPFVIGE